MLTFWVLLFGITTSSIGVSYGAPYTLLDPEYMGQVSFWSFWWIGVAIGFFVTAWHLSCYMLNSFRFPFLATSRRPFLHFCINNSVIPLAFVVTYIIAVVRFQVHNEFTPIERVPLYIAGFLGGMAFICGLFGIYFHHTNRDIKTIKHRIATPKRQEGRYLGANVGTIDVAASSNTNPQVVPNTTESIIRKMPDWEQPYRNPKIERVDYYLNANFKIRPTRGTEHYTQTALNAVFQQHHTNALMVQVVALISTMFLGIATDIPVFQLPAAASLLLILVIIVSLMGAFTYWLTGWRSISAIIVFFILNQSASFDLLNYNTPAYGLNYDTTAAVYSDTLIKKPISDAQIAADRASMLPILDNWKRKAQAAQGLRADQKPDMLLLNFSGGGSRSMLWSMVAVQTIDSLLHGKLLDNTFLMAGASGGMLGAAYIRELYYRQQTNHVRATDIVQPASKTVYISTNPTLLQTPKNVCLTPDLSEKMPSFGGVTGLDNAGKDFLNPIFFAAATNDLFFPFRWFEAGGYSYRRNRAYAFERQYHTNTDSVIANRTIADYRLPEQQAQVPLLIITPTIVSNGKKLIITPHPVSYLCRPTNLHNFENSSIETDGIELSYLSAQNGYNMLLSSALRMNATYPFILPDTYLPTTPDMQIMDAGFRDNHGFETTFRMLLNFNTWIADNVDEVVMIFVRSDLKDEVNNYPKQTYVERYFKPIQAFITTNMQDFQVDFGATALDEVLQGKLTVINLEYVPTANNESASMSLHLTKKEKHDIRQAIYMPANKRNAQKLVETLQH